MTGKELLAVFGACWEVGGVDPDRLDPMLVDFGDRRAAQKATYGGEPFRAQVAAEPGGTTYLDFLRLDRLARRRKGIIAIELEAPT